MHRGAVLNTEDPPRLWPLLAVAAWRYQGAISSFQMMQTAARCRHRILSVPLPHSHGVRPSCAASGAWARRREAEPQRCGVVLCCSPARGFFLNRRGVHGGAFGFVSPLGPFHPWRHVARPTRDPAAARRQPPQQPAAQRRTQRQQTQSRHTKKKMHKTILSQTQSKRTSRLTKKKSSSQRRSAGIPGSQFRMKSDVWVSPKPGTQHLHMTSAASSHRSSVVWSERMLSKKLASGRCCVFPEEVSNFDPEGPYQRD